MKELPAFRNYDVCSFMMELTNNVVESYKIDVAYDVRSLYNLVLKGNTHVFWGVRRCGTAMGYENSEGLKYYKDNNLAILFELSNLRINNGYIFGDISLISYKEPYKNKWYNEIGVDSCWYRAGDDYDVFYNEVRRICRNFISNSND